MDPNSIPDKRHFLVRFVKLNNDNSIDVRIPDEFSFVSNPFTAVFAYE